MNTCARCGREFEGYEAMIGDAHYCHGDAHPSCYEVASWADRIIERWESSRSTSMEGLKTLLARVARDAGKGIRYPDRWPPIADAEQD